MWSLGVLLGCVELDWGCALWLTLGAERAVSVSCVVAVIIGPFSCLGCR